MTDFKVQNMREALEQVYNPPDILEEYEEESVQQLDEGVWFLGPAALAIATRIGGATLKAYQAWKKASKIKGQAAKAEKLRKQLAKQQDKVLGKTITDKNGKVHRQFTASGKPNPRYDAVKGGQKQQAAKRQDAPATKADVTAAVKKAKGSLPKRVALAIAKNPIKSSIVGGVLYYGGKAILGDDGKPIRMSEEERNRIIQKSKDQKDKGPKDQKFSKTKDGKKGDVFMGPRPTVFGPKERGKKVQDDIMKMRKELGGYGMPKHHSQTMTAKQRKERKPTFEPDKPEPKKKEPKVVQPGDTKHPLDRSDIESGATGGQPKKSQTKISAKGAKGPDAYKVAGETRQQDRLDPNRSDAKAKRKESEKPPLTKKQTMAQKKIDSLPTHTATQREYKQKTQIGFDKHLKKTNENFDLDEAMSSSQISQLKKAFEPMRGKRISMSSGDKLRKILDKVSDDKNVLVQLYKADIPFVSRGAATRLISKHNVKGAELNAMSEEIMLDEKISGLVKKSDKSGISYGTLKKVYDRGMAAWKTGHRPGTTPQQWAFARVNSFITKGKGTWGGADKDLAKQVKEEAEMHESLWANIHAKRARGEKMRKKGEKGAPTEAQMARAKAASEDFKVENMRDAMKEVWKNGVKMQEKRKEKENGLRVLKAGKTMTGGQPAYIQLQPKLDTRARP